MDKRRRLFLISCFVFIDVLLIGVFFLFRDVRFKLALQNEVNALVELDFSKDLVNSSIKTKGHYAVVEKTLKSYFQVHSANIQTVDEYKNDLILDDLTSVSNYILDGPYFIDSLKYIENYKNKFNVYVDNLILNTCEENIDTYIYNFTEDENDVEMYRSLIRTNGLIDIVLEDREYLINKKTLYNNYFDSITNLFLFLSNNKDFYYIDGNNDMVFLNDDVRLEYENLLGQIKRIN